MKNKKLLLAAVILFIVLFTGVVYAAESGSLTFTGRVARTSILDLELENISLNDIRFGEIVETADANKKSMRFYVLLTQPGDTRIINFNIVNAGNMAARLQELDVVTPEASAGVAITWTPLANLVIMPGESAGPFAVTITWDIEEQNLPSGSFDVEAFINYSQT